MSKIERAKELVNLLTFDECISLVDKLPAGNKIIDLVFDRMEALDLGRFDLYLDGAN